MQQKPKFIEFRNESDSTVRYDGLGIECEPQKTCMIPVEYAFPRKTYAGGRGKAVVEMVLPQLKPVSQEDKDRFAQGSDEDEQQATPAKLPTVEQFVKAGTPRGVAEMLVQAAQAAIASAKNPSPEPAEKLEDDKPKSDRGKSDKWR